MSTESFLGLPYPVLKTPKGFFYSQGGIDQVKSDLICLILTNPGERVMNPAFGTPLRKLLFEPNDLPLQVNARNTIINAIRTWEPRIAIQQIEVTSGADRSSLNATDDFSQWEHILYVRITFYDPQNLTEIQELVLEVPLTGGA